MFIYSTRYQKFFYECCYFCGRLPAQGFRHLDMITQYDVIQDIGQSLCMQIE